MLSVLAFAAAAGCAAAAPDPIDDRNAATETANPPPPSSAPPDPAGVRANELGLVPVLMYHQLTSEPDSEYDQTPAKFRAELERLHREHYRPVTAAAYISGDIDIPAGTHPVVLTFDDSTLSQLTFTADGKVAPDTAVGILEQFRTEHPDFAPTATFYVNNQPFGDNPGALQWLAAHGYEIGAHTATHPNLAHLDAAGVQREFAENVRAITAAAPGEVRTMALPLGIFPADRALASAGSWDGTSYSFEAIMLVGANPAPSPYGGADPAGIPRIRSGRTAVDFDSTYWLDRLAQHPDQRYTSDGNPDVISFPQHASGDLTARWASHAKPY
ncbi:polysaccharide deacetylase family protein [Nocardia iowensis]|uniref:Polysaccharide deacetylase family protein n=1 Tax=Nocardia iowensis TaxID=204891 RepID=A0ABX8RYS9_NOCIO|nr:polysaccharide deacetylase family protein [Nocardia iowensis]QXN94793.1 polysaccharide deacetylase family protein [Nocardia iowensis]